MSVVGPRPERPFFVHKIPEQVFPLQLATLLESGHHGWASSEWPQGDTSIEKRVEYDLYYMRHWTFTFDLHIHPAPLFRGFSDDNAY